MNAFKKIRESFLIERLKKGDKDAFAQVYDEYSQSIYRYIYFKVSDQHIAEDLTGNVFLKCWEYIKDDKKKVDNIRSFLYSVAHNLVIDYYRSKKETVDLASAEQLKDETKLPLDLQISANQATQKLIKSLATLPDDYNDIITLHYIEEYSVREIAQILGKKENNIRVILHRALKSLKEKYKDE